MDRTIRIFLSNGSIVETQGDSDEALALIKEISKKKVVELNNSDGILQWIFTQHVVRVEVF